MARDWTNKLDDIANINMMIKSIAADPLPADPHAPVKVPKDQPGSSPWLPGKSPAPSRQQWVRNNNDMKIAHGEGRGPQQKFHDEYNRPLDKPPWRHINPRGEPIDIDWQKEEYMEEHPQFFSKNQGMTIADSTRRDNMIRQAIEAYGKTKGGKYIDERKLLQSLPRV